MAVLGFLYIFFVMKNITNAPIRVQKKDKKDAYSEAVKLLKKMGLEDKKDAYRILKTLSNHKHYVYTGYAIHQNDKFVTGVSKSTVIFNDLSDELINSYIASGSPMDKAGAYGIQCEFSKFIKKIDGNYDSVVGLPVSKLYTIIKKYL